MLLTSLQCEYEGTLSTVVLCHTYDAPRHLAHEFLRAAHISQARTTKCHRYAEALCLAYGDVGTPFSRSLEDGKVGCDAVDDEQRLLFVAGLSHSVVVLYDAVVVRLLHDDTGSAAFLQLRCHVGKVGNTVFSSNVLDVEAVHLGIGFHDAYHLRVDGLADEYCCGFLGLCICHHGCLGCCNGAIVHRGIGEVHAC